VNSHVLTYVTRPRWLAIWLIAGWLGGVATVQLSFPEYRGHWPDSFVMAWARGGIPVSMLLLGTQLSWQMFRRDAIALVVGLPLGGAAYAAFIWVGTRVLPFWMSDSMVVLWAGVFAGALPLGALWNAYCLRARPRP
jgi:hypothetical protein